MKRIILFALAVCMLFVSLVVGLAATDKQSPNDPTVNADANACYTGGSMAGKCKSDNELWKAGWYEIRFEYGLISANQVPDQYKWLLDTRHDANEPATTPEA